MVLPLCKRSKQKLFFKTWKNIPRNSISHHWSVENASYELVITQLSNYNFNIMFLFYWHVSEETWRSDNRMISYHSDYNAADTIGVDVYGLSLSGYIPALFCRTSDRRVWLQHFSRMHLLVIRLLYHIGSRRTFLQKPWIFFSHYI